MGKIFVRERVDVGEGAGRPRFAIVAVEGVDVEFLRPHVRKSELDAIAQAVAAEVVMLPKGGGEHPGEAGDGHRRRGGRGRRAGGAASA
jgi:hypothetical protein